MIFQLTEIKHNPSFNPSLCRNSNGWDKEERGARTGRWSRMGRAKRFLEYFWNSFQEDTFIGTCEQAGPDPPMAWACAPSAKMQTDIRSSEC